MLRAFQLCVLLIIMLHHTAPQKPSPARPVQEDPCAKAMSQFDLDECWGQQYGRADAHLNALYRKLLGLMEKDLINDKQQNDVDMVKFDETALLDLKKTERLWIRYRDSQCDAAAQQIDGGSMAPMTRSICLMDATNHRIDELKDAYETPDRKLE